MIPRVPRTQACGDRLVPSLWEAPRPHKRVLWVKRGHLRAWQGPQGSPSLHWQPGLQGQSSVVSLF